VKRDVNVLGLDVGIWACVCQARNHLVSDPCRKLDHSRRMGVRSQTGNSTTVTVTPTTDHCWQLEGRQGQPVQAGAKLSEGALVRDSMKNHLQRIPHSIDDCHIIIVAVPTVLHLDV
jgi:hypothetical protein